MLSRQAHRLFERVSSYRVDQLNTRTDTLHDVTAAAVNEEEKSDKLEAEIETLKGKSELTIMELAFDNPIGEMRDTDSIRLQSHGLEKGVKLVIPPASGAAVTATTQMDSGGGCCDRSVRAEGHEHRYQ